MKCNRISNFFFFTDQNSSGDLWSTPPAAIVSVRKDLGSWTADAETCSSGLWNELGVIAAWLDSVILYTRRQQFNKSSP